MIRAAGALLLLAALAPAVGSALEALREGSPASGGRVWISAAGASAGAAPASHHFGAPPGHTGGFGEPSCDFCHFDRELNEKGGSLELEGLPPEGYRPGESYELTLRLRHPELRLAGFQLTVRYASGEKEGEQAGRLIAGEGQDVTTQVHTGIGYLGHRHDGTAPTQAGARSWVFGWKAPGRDPKADGVGEAAKRRAAEGDAEAGTSEPAGGVVIHAAGNAADGDGSEFGDRIYTVERVLPPKDGSPGGT